jgi:hypothetical protein
LEIYNASNKWDKEKTLYHSFGEDRSSFGFLTYDEAKERKDVLRRLFSKKAVADVQGLILEKVWSSSPSIMVFWPFRTNTVQGIEVVLFVRKTRL